MRDPAIGVAAARSASGAHLLGMTASMRVMSAGDGYEYLLRTVATSDGDRSLSTPLTRYYSEEGTPPGFWLGSGLPYLGDGQLTAGSRVSETQLQLLVGMGPDPLTGEPLGEAYRTYAGVQERIDQRTAALGPALGPVSRAGHIAVIEAEERERGTRRAVAGYDLTFAVPKSLSVLCGVAGVLATAFDHYDSRAGDPQLHTHVVVSNKVLTVQDQTWRTLAGRPVHASVVAVSELYNAILADRITSSCADEHNNGN